MTNVGIDEGHLADVEFAHLSHMPGHIVDHRRRRFGVDLQRARKKELLWEKI